MISNSKTVFYYQPVEIFNGTTDHAPSDLHSFVKKSTIFDLRERKDGNFHQKLKEDLKIFDMREKIDINFHWKFIG